MCTYSSNAYGGVVVFLEKRTVANKIMFLKQFGQAHEISAAEEPFAVSAYDLAHAQPQAPRPHEQAGLPSEMVELRNDHDEHATIISLFTFGTARSGSSNRERAPSTRRSSERRHVPVGTPSSKIERKTSRRHSRDYTELRECFMERCLRHNPAYSAWQTPITAAA